MKNYRLLFPDGAAMPVLRHNTGASDLAAWAKAIFGVDALELIHQLPDPQVFSSYVHRLYYRVNQLKDHAEQIKEPLERICNEILIPLIGEVLKIQFPPSIRCHLAGAGTASAFHRDGDPKYGVSPQSLNLWIPLTRVWGTNSIHIEETVDSGIYRPVALQPGEMLVFDAYHLMHGSYPNNTPLSRISLDIRFVPKDVSIARKLGLYATP
jgi:hypothetical protein